MRHPFTAGGEPEMNVLGISGSPRERSNSHILLLNALQPFEEAGWSVKVLRLRNLSVKPCTACDHCTEHPGQCVIDDDMDLFIDAFRTCEALIVATPVYSRNVCAQLMAVFDRHCAVALERPLYGKVGGAIAVGAGGGGGQSIAICTIYNWMRSCGVVGVPGELNGVTAVAREEGEILAQEKRLRQARTLGDNVLWFADKIRSEQ
jgi:multimeric flavodoxin WrbA